MVLDKGVTAVNLLKFWEETCGHVAGTLEGTEESLDGFLPGFDVLPTGSGEDLASGSEAFIGIYFCNDIEGFSHDEVILWYSLGRILGQ